MSKTLMGEIARIQSAKDNIVTSIENKGVNVPDNTPIENLPALIDSIPTGGGSVDLSKSVKFYDCDGTVLYSYDKAEALALTELPQLPTRTGFTCQGWNYTLAQLKTEVNDHDKCDIGAMYVTDDGKTRIKIRIESRWYSNISIYFNQTTSSGVTIDWGDGSLVETIPLSGNVNTSHQYNPVSYPTEYTITLNCTSGTMSFYTNIFGKTETETESSSNPIYAFTSQLKEVSIGNNVTSIGNYAFQYCYSLKSINIPSNITSIGNYAFQYCYPLQSITIPSSITSIGTRVFYYCYLLQSITIPSSVTSIGNNAFRYCTSLKSINIPSNVTSIGTYAFSNCTSLQLINIPSNVTSIRDYAFNGCNSLQSITIPSNVTSIGTQAFYCCYSLQSITIPSNVISIGDYAFYNCWSLQSIIISNSVTSIGIYAFYYCDSLQSINIPSNVTSIGDYVFRYCYGLKVFDFSNHTSVPTLDNVNAFQNTSSTKYIVVPDDLYSNWITTNNWNSTTNNIVNCIIKKSDFDLL